MSTKNFKQKKTNEAMTVDQTQKDPTATQKVIVPLRSPKKKVKSPHKVAGSSVEAFRKIRTAHKDTTLTCRFELKYRIRETKARAIAHYIQSYIRPDQYAKKCPDYQYRISSTYFDSEELHLCRETIEQKKNRFKLRVRCYDEDPNTPCFFEVKRRLNNVILKDRARMSKSDFKRAVEDLYTPGGLYKKDREILNQFQFYLQILQARPIVMVRYMRQAYEDDSRNRIRVTFDRGLSFKVPDSPIIETNGTDWYPVPMDFVILEIKFNDRYPLWLNDVVKIFDLKQTAMSKYVSSVEQSCSMGFCSPRCLVGT